MRAALAVCALLCIAATLPPPAEQALGAARAAQRSGDRPGAIRAYREVLRAAPTYGDAYRQLRELYGGQPGADLQRQLEGAVATDPRDFISWNLLGVLYARARRWDRALAALGRALAIEPRDVDARTNLGWVLAELRRTDEAEQAFREALRLAPGDARAHAGLGGLYGEVRGEWALAIGEYRKALEADPQEPAYWSDLGWAYFKAGRTGLAEESIRQSLALDPARVVTRANLGWVLLKLGRGAAAEEQFREALRRQEGFPFAEFGLGRSLAQQGKWRGAFEAYRRAWRESRNDVYLLYVAGAALRLHWLVVLLVLSVVAPAVALYINWTFKRDRGVAKGGAT